MQNTAGGQGYIQQNMYNILDINGANNTNDDTTATIPGVERATTPSSDNAGSTYAATNASSNTVCQAPRPSTSWRLTRRISYNRWRP